MSEHLEKKALALLRVSIGVWLLWIILPNLDRAFIEKIAGILDNFAQTNPYPFYRWMLHYLAWNNAEQLGTFISVGQFLVASALIIGFLCRFCAVIALLYTINLYFIAGHQGFFYSGFCILLGILFTVFFIGDIGRYYGLDGLLFKEKSPDEKIKRLPVKNKKQKDAIETLSKALKKDARKLKKVKSAD